MDRLTPEHRSYLMSRVRSRDTSPELRVRKTAHALGFRFRLYVKDLPGRPDMVFRRLRSVILVHGCFWHRHAGCRKASSPKDRADYWNEKFARNVERDIAAQQRLEADGWRVLVVWECETKDQDLLSERISAFLTAEARVCFSQTGL